MSIGIFLNICRHVRAPEKEPDFAAKLQKGHGTDTSVLPSVRRPTVPGRADQNAFVRQL
jgi:hypothetical protein